LKLTFSQVNIGIIEEDPSTTAGTIKIMSRISKEMPSGLEYVIFGDGGAVERMQDAIRARSASTCSDERFDFAHPTPQDFHRRMKLFRVRI
jgi:hypothetical protein